MKGTDGSDGAIREEDEVESDVGSLKGLKDGDLDWFNEGIMVKVFEDEIKNHKKGDVFIVNIPKRKWYYVVYKTQDDKEKIKLTYIEKEE